MATLTLSGAEANSIIRNQYSLKDTDCVSILSSQNAESQDIIGCIRSGQKLQAIKIVRDFTNCGLKEGKDFVDQVTMMLDNLYRF